MQGREQVIPSAWELHEPRLSGVDAAILEVRA
jgi:hypothetical protein